MRTELKVRGEDSKWIKFDSSTIHLCSLLVTIQTVTEQKSEHGQVTGLACDVGGTI
jgi:hypothetical protein